jgi:tRNA threonylcarbamoyl adenosine modification protein (Sua5/YciO/YrdC/YwlC family)
MAQFLVIHPDHPQPRLVRRAVETLRDGGLIVYPTDSCYALGCRIGDNAAMQRLRRIRRMDETHHLTLVCRDLSQIAQFARIDNRQYRLLRATTPGGYTFILVAGREVPKRLLNPRRKTIGLRVPEHRVVHVLLDQLDEPILSSTLILPGDELPMTDAAEIRVRLQHDVDLVIDGGSCGVEMTTVIDLTGDEPVVIRTGRGPVEPFVVAEQQA